MKGVLFGLFANENIFDNFGELVYSKGELVDKFFTDDNGKIRINNLLLGKYYLKEISTNSNYVLDNSIYDFELVYKDQYTSNISYNFALKNYLAKGVLKFSKVDFYSDEPLSGALIEVYTENGVLVFSGETDDDGNIVISDLPIGRYYIVEKVAPDGYILSCEKLFFEIEFDGHVVDKVMKNKKSEIVLVGDTALDDNSILYCAGFIFLGFIFIVFGYVKKFFL